MLLSFSTELIVRFMPTSECIGKHIPEVLRATLKTFPGAIDENIKIQTDVCRVQCQHITDRNIWYIISSARRISEIVLQLNYF